MRKVRQVLPSALGNDEVLRAARAQAAMRRWSEIVGPMLAEKSYPDRYSRGTVWVAVQGSAWAQELRMTKDRILVRLGEVSGEPSLFKDVRFGVRALPERPKQPDLGPSEEKQKEDQELTILEIAARRLAKWKNAGAD